MAAPKNVNDYGIKREWLQRLALIVILGGVLLSLPSLCEAHAEAETNPSFKYSREANENFQPEEHHHHHHHDHDHHDHDHHDHDHDDHHHHAHEHKQEHHKEKRETRGSKVPLDMATVWLHSMGSTLLISAAPFLLLYVIPLDSSDAMKPRLKVLLAFASGGLLGDAFLHLIPHATHPHTHHDSHDHGHHHHHHHEEEAEGAGHSHGHDMTIGLWVLGGIIAFLAVEKFVRLVKGGHGHSHGHAQPSAPPASVKAKAEPTKTKAEPAKAAANAAAKAARKAAAAAEPSGEVAIAGYLNLAADFAHNFTDGLAIGASYLAGNSIGVVTTITILLHEVPHEIGDFAILIKSGCTRRKAILLQLVTALGALAGTALALVGASAGGEAAPVWVLPFTAGGFIYIATVSVLPELLEESTKLGQSLKEIVAMLTGVALMVVIAHLE